MKVKKFEGDSKISYDVKLKKIVSIFLLPGNNSINPYIQTRLNFTLINFC